MRLILILASLLLVCGGSAQNLSSLRGKVLIVDQSDQGEGLGQSQEDPEYVGLPGAYVRWSHDASSTTVTDGFGFFKISNANVGDTLIASMIGYSPAGWVFDGSSYVDIPLSLGVDLGQAEVVERKAATQFSLLSPLDVQSLNRKELAKAACCNLSEAFETNASVDASFTDAVTGTRQIRMLGLDGKYSQIQVDNLPGPRGLSVVQGLLFIPGDWVNEIHISKGAGTVTQGYESITGQINVALKNPETADPHHANLYVNGAGRKEFNYVSRYDVSRRWSTAILIHGLHNEQANDRNQDGFLDTPMQHHFVGRNEWKFKGDRGIRGEYAATYVNTEAVAGKASVFEGASDWNGWMGRMDSLTSDWSAITAIERIELSAKTGFVFPDAEWRTIGTQWNYYNHQHDQRFGKNHYSGNEQFFRGNVLYSDILGSTNRNFTVGATYVYNAFSEDFSVNDSLRMSPSRKESVPGAFVEYTWNPNERWSVIGGIRYDRHNLFRHFLSPRFHARWSATENTSIKVAAGKGYRTSNQFMEQLGTWASQRQWNLNYYGKTVPEEATNFGLNITSKFRLNYREATLTLDGYSTQFQNKLVVDLDRSTGTIDLYALEGQSFANSAQAEFNWDIHRRWDMRMAYRWVNAHTDRTSGNPTLDPFVSRHRAFSQFSYASQLNDRDGQWRGDLTCQWIGAQRLPTTSSNPEAFQRTDMAPDFFQVNAQITRQFSPEFSIYVGVENALNYTQDRPILAADYDLEPVSSSDFDQYFDASLVYGPIFGRMLYAGLRWGILAPKAHGE
jgi:outer membrane receptor for ferrienterochelin and colicin